MTAPGPDDAPLPPTKSAPRPAVCSGPEFRLRLASALILAPVALVALWLGGVAFAALFAVGAALMLAEWRGIIGANRPAVVFPLALLVGLAVLLPELWRPEAGLALLALLAIASAFEPGARQRPLLVGGVFYAGLPCLASVALRGGDHGMLAMAFIFAVVWATDIGAYFAGRRFGGPKLWPQVSPKKTWSGAIGGLVAAVVLGTGLVTAFGVGHMPSLAGIAALLSVASQAGDLYESSLKRRFGVKDSGTIIPGHGGVLDRLDGLVAALVVAWLIGALIGGGDVAAGLLTR